MNIGETLTKSFQTVWKHKVLWLFGLLVFILYALYLPFSLLVGPFNRELFPDLIPFDVVEELLSLLISLLSVGLLLITIPLYLIGIVSTALGTVRAEKGEDALTFGELLRDSFRFFWRALGVRAIFIIAGMVALIPIMLVMFAVNLVTFGFGMLCLFPLFILFIPFSYVLYAAMELAESSIVADDLSVTEALSKTWELVKGNFWKLLLLAVIIYLGLGLVAGIVVIPLLLPAYVPLFGVMMGNGQPAREILLISTACLCITTPLYAFGQGIVLVFQKVTWTQTYLALTRQPAETPLEVSDVQ